MVSNIGQIGSIFFMKVYAYLPIFYRRWANIRGKRQVHGLRTTSRTLLKHFMKERAIVFQQNCLEFHIHVCNDVFFLSPGVFNSADSFPSTFRPRLWETSSGVVAVLFFFIHMRFETHR